MSASSIIRAGRPAYPGPVRRIAIVLLVLAVVGLVVYRNRAIARHEQELAGQAPSPGAG